MGLAGLAALIAADTTPLWLGAWTALAVGLTTATIGLRAGAAAVAFVAVVAWALPSDGRWFAFTAEPLRLGATAALAWAAGWLSRLGTVRQAAAAAAGERRTRLLVEATLSLQQAVTSDDVLAALPPLVRRIMTTDHTTTARARGGALEIVTSLPADLRPGTPVPDRSVMARALRSGERQVVPDARLDPEYHAFGGPPPARAEVALPLRAQGAVVGVLNVERSLATGVDADDLAVLEALARVAETNLERVASLAEVEARRRESALLAEAGQRLAHVADVHDAGAVALRALEEGVGAPAGAVLVAECGAFRPIAVRGDVPAPMRAALEAGLPRDLHRLQSGWRSGEVRVVDDYAAHGANEDFARLGLRSLVVMPAVDSDGETVALVALAAFDGPRSWTPDQLALTLRVCETLGPVLARLRLRERQAELLDVVRRMAHADTASDLYQHAAEAALRVVPGAEASSLLARQPDDDFRFEGAVGFDLETLRTAGPLSEAQQRGWYGGSEADWREGRPRVRTGAAIARTSAETATDEARPVLAEAGRAAEIRANLCVPVSLHGEVLALLNIDAFSTDEAFGTSSLALAEALAQHVAVIVRRTLDQAALTRSALTDPLTGLGNREAFNRALARELQRARRHDEPLAVALLDLDGFKAVNDTLGHAGGDQALAEVANALRASVRASDEVFRWGGDEFVVVMPMLAPDAGHAAARRLAAAIRALDFRGVRLDASLGLASYPEDGADADALLRRADDLMYAIKASRRTPR